MLIKIDDELAISLLESATDDKSTNLSEDNACVLWSTWNLELFLIAGTDDKTMVDDETSKDFAVDKIAVLWSVDTL